MPSFRGQREAPTPPLLLTGHRPAGQGAWPCAPKSSHLAGLSPAQRCSRSWCQRLLRLLGAAPQGGPDFAGREGGKAPDPTVPGSQTQPVPHPNPLWRGAHASRRPHCLQRDDHQAPCFSAPREGTGGPQHGDWPPKVSRGSAGGLVRSNAPGRGAQEEWPPRRGWGPRVGAMARRWCGVTGPCADTHLGGSAVDTARATARGPPGADRSRRHRRLPGPPCAPPPARARRRPPRLAGLRSAVRAARRLGCAAPQPQVCGAAGSEDTCAQVPGRAPGRRAGAGRPGSGSVCCPVHTRLRTRAFVDLQRLRCGKRTAPHLRLSGICPSSLPRLRVSST